MNYELRTKNECFWHQSLLTVDCCLLTKKRTCTRPFFYLITVNVLLASVSGMALKCHHSEGSSPPVKSS